MAIIQVQSVIAESYDAIKAQLDSIMHVWEVDSADLLDHKITPYGAGRFIITILYTGGYLWHLSYGLKASSIRKDIEKAAKLPLAGLALDLLVILGIRRSLTALTGLLASSIVKDISKSVSSLTGMISDITYEYIDSNPVVESFLGLISSISKLLEMSRPQDSPLGLSVNITTQYTNNP